jgi:molybdate transport system ATP-binding protein
MSISLRYELQREDFHLDTDVEIPMHGITGVFGESGSGKTTLLRCIAGLEQNATGRLVVGGDVWQDQSQNVSRRVHEREIGYVFQEPRLFRHLSVQQNLNYGRSRSGKAAADISFDQVVQLLGLEKLLHRRPEALSGGEAQRVAIARALLRAPKVVLMDEPLAALDRSRKDDILPFLDRLHAELSLPIIYVSHNIEEVCRLCDHLIVIENGKVLANQDLQSALVRMDLPILSGDEAGSVVHGTVRSYDPDYELTQFEFAGGNLSVPGMFAEIGSNARLRIRASDISLCRDQPQQSTILNTLPVLIDEFQEVDGPSVLVRLKIGTDFLLARITRRSRHELNLRPGDNVFAQIKAVAVRSGSLDQNSID